MLLKQSVSLYATACCMQRTHHPLAASQAHNQWSESRDRPLSLFSPSLPPSPIPAWRWHIYGALCSNVAITHCSWLPLDWMQPSPPSERWGSLISKYSLWKQELMNRNQGGINGHLKSTLFMPPSSPLSSPLFLLANQLGSVLCGFLEILQSGPADSGTKFKVRM